MCIYIRVYALFGECTLKIEILSFESSDIVVTRRVVILSTTLLEYLLLHCLNNLKY